jgi:hypothetical protein
MGFGTTFQKLIMKPSRKMGRQLEDYVKTTYMGDPNGIEGLRRKRQDNGTDLGKLRSEALANGFNPLTVLRATGGQGFYKNEIPMGRLSSDAFFNTFDRIKQRNYNKLPSVDNANDNMMYGSQVAETTSPIHKQPKLAFNNSPLYPVRPTEIENDYISTGKEFVANKTTALKRPLKLPDGRVIMVPFDPEDMDPMTVAMGYAVLGLSKFTELFPNFRPIKGFKNFGKLIRDKAKQDTNKESDLLLKLQQQMNYKEGAISQKALGTLRNISDEDQKFVDFMKAQF